MCRAHHGLDISWGFLERLESMLPPEPPPIHGPEAAPEPGPSLALARFTQLAVRGVIAGRHRHHHAWKVAAHFGPLCLLARIPDLMMSQRLPKEGVSAADCLPPHVKA
jgi:hypothetical protein